MTELERIKNGVECLKILATNRIEMGNSIEIENAGPSELELYRFIAVVDWKEVLFLCEQIERYLNEGDE